MSELDLDRRTGWPADLRLFVERYPRAVWPGHANLGQTARFWLERHDMFRDLGGALNSATAQFREGALPLAEFRAGSRRACNSSCRNSRCTIRSRI